MLELTGMALSQRYGMDAQSLGAVEGKCSSQRGIQNIYAAQPSPQVSPSSTNCPACLRASIFETDSALQMSALSAS